MSMIEDCQRCVSRSHCVTGQVDPVDQPLVRSLMLCQTRLVPGDVLIHPGMAFERVYLIRYGCFKTVLLDADGHMHTASLHSRGEMLGLEGLGHGSHQCEVTALQHASVCVFRFDQWCELSRKIQVLQQAWYKALSRAMHRDWQQMLLLGCMNGEERVAHFLMSLRDRQMTGTMRPDMVDLMMTRQEIGNFLGMTLESVSRHLSQFQRRGWIRLDRRRVHILQPVSLTHRRELPQRSSYRSGMGHSEQSLPGV